jgi:phasin
VNDADVKVETNADPMNETANGNAKLRFDVPFFNIRGLFGGFVEQGASRAKENVEKMKAASEEISDGLREACSTNAKGAGDYSAKVIEISNINAKIALEFLSLLADTKSLVDALNLSTTQGRRTFEAAIAQNQELWALAQKLAIETAAPIKQSVDRVMRKSV